MTARTSAAKAAMTLPGMEGLAAPRKKRAAKAAGTAPAKPARKKAAKAPEPELTESQAAMLAEYERQAFKSTLTDEQLAVVEKSFSGRESLTAVQAYAGSGKTHTLQAFAEERPYERILYLTFSKALADEASAKFKRAGLSNVEARTIHSLAWRWFMDRRNQWHVASVGGLEPALLIPWAKRWFPHVDKRKAVVTAARICAWMERFFTSDAPTPEALLESSCLTKRDRAAGISDPGALAECMDAVYRNCLEDARPRGFSRVEQLPMPHNGYLKTMQLAGGDLGWDYVLVDEAQDVSSCMIGIVEAQHSHRICIGDSFQQIYGWNGAVDALPKLVAKGAEELWLTKSFRCPADAAARANAFLRLLGAKHPFRGRDEDAAPSAGTTSAWLFRSNAGVFDKAWECVENRRPFSLAGGMSSYNFDELFDLESWMLAGRAQSPRTRDMAKIFGSFKEYEEYAKEWEPHAAAQCSLVRRHGGSLRHMMKGIKDACRRSGGSVAAISTAHKAKGGEWDRIALGPDFYDVNKDLLTPMKKGQKQMLMNADDPAIREACAAGRKVVRAEELRLLYVAVTRTKGESSVPEFYLPEPAAVHRLREGIKSGSIVMI